MARSSTNTIPVRKVLGFVLVFVGLFAICYGLGSRSEALIVTGAAVMVLSVSSPLLTMFRRSPRQWVLGTGQVIQVYDEPPEDARHGRCELELTADAPGLSGETVRVIDPRAPVSQWPAPGMQLPIEVAVDDPRSVRIRWKQIPVRRDAAEDVLGRFGGEPDPYAESPSEAGRYDAPYVAPFDAGSYADDYDGDPVGAGLHPGDSGPYGSDPSGSDPYDSPPGPSHAEPASVPAARVVDFDLDDPPAAVDADGLPPDLGEVRQPATASQAPATPPQAPAADSQAPAAASEAPAAASEAPVAAAEPAPPELPRPRPRPRPYPTKRRDPAPAAGAAGAGVAAPAGAGAATPAPAQAVLDDLVTTYPSAHPGPAGAITNVGITVLVADLSRAITFYRDTLGFYEVDGGDGNTVLASGETRLVLRVAPELAPVRHRSLYLNLEVSDLDAAYTELKADGLRFTNPPRPVNRTARLELWAATFRDPDGHGIALTQWRPARSAGEQGAGVGDGDD